MDRQALESLQLSTEQIEQVLAYTQAAAEQHKGESEGLRVQLSEASAQIERFKQMDIEGVRRAATEWEEKYTALSQKQQDEAYNRVLESVAGRLQFSSESAKRSFLLDLQQQKLSMQGQELLGFDDFVKSYQSKDAAAFATEKVPPRVVASTQGTEEVTKNHREQANEAIRALFGK